VEQNRQKVEIKKVDQRKVGKSARREVRIKKVEVDQSRSRVRVAARWMDKRLEDKMEE
jgi:hypothetical protein